MANFLTVFAGFFQGALETSVLLAGILHCASIREKGAL